MKRRAISELQHGNTDENAMRTWPEVAAEWHRRSGEQLTRQRVWQIGMKAERKLFAAMLTTFRELRSEAR